MNCSLKDILNVIDEAKVKFNEPLKKYTTFKIGGPADVLVKPENEQDVLSCVKFCKENNIPLHVLGNGSKVLIKDGGLRGVVLHLGKNYATYKIEGDEIFVAAGVSLPLLCVKAKNAGLAGLEFACGIPASVGGAIYMNAGAYGSEMANVVTETTYLDSNLEICTVSGNDHEFGYRQSIFRKHPEYIILSCKMKLTADSKENIEAKMNENRDSRVKKQPLEYASAGSAFKRPEGYFAGKLVQDAGLKGYSIGDAEVSIKHSGFVVNKGSATAKDVCSLLTHIKKVVLEKFGVQLEEEIIIMGDE
jgi:UDP-N-acetylmuramate dehydrogenase